MYLQTSNCIYLNNRDLRQRIAGGDGRKDGGLDFFNGFHWCYDLRFVWFFHEVFCCSLLKEYDSDGYLLLVGMQIILLVPICIINVNDWNPNDNRRRGEKWWKNSLFRAQISRGLPIIYRQVSLGDSDVFFWILIGYG